LKVIKKKKSIEKHYKKNLNDLKKKFTCGGLITAAKCLIPNMPKLDTVKVPPLKKINLELDIVFVIK